MVKLDVNGVAIEWIRGSKNGLKAKVSKADADKLISTGWAKALDAPPKDKAVKKAPEKK
jgi:hypothetical protein